MSNITLNKRATNYTTVTVPTHEGNVVLAFSYETCIGVELAAEWPGVACVNEWGPTTGKHLNDWDGGGKDARARRVPLSVLNRIVEAALAGAGTRELAELAVTLAEAGPVTAEHVEVARRLLAEREAGIENVARRVAAEMGAEVYAA